MGNKCGKFKNTKNNEVLATPVAGSSDHSSTLCQDLVTGIVRVKKIILQCTVRNNNGKCKTSRNKQVSVTTVAGSSDSSATLDPALSGSSATPSLFRNSTDPSLSGSSRCSSLSDVSESPSSCGDSIASSSSDVSESPSSCADSIASSSSDKSAALSLPVNSTTSSKSCHLASNKGLSEEITQNINTILPDEMLLKIFSYMTSDELLSIQFVCTKWQNISRDDTLWKDYKFVTSNLSLTKIASKLKIMPALKNITGSALKDVVYIILGHVTNLKQMNCVFEPAMSATEVQILIEYYPKLESVLLYPCDADFMSSLTLLAHSGYIKKLIIFIFCETSECLCKQNIINMFLLLNDNKSFPVLETLHFPTFIQEDISSNPDLQCLIPQDVAERCHLLKSVMESFDDEINMNLPNVSYKYEGIAKLDLCLSEEEFPVISFNKFTLLEGVTIKLQVVGNLFPENLYAPLNSKSLLHITDLKVYVIHENEPTEMLPELEILKVCVENLKQLVYLYYKDVRYLTSENQLQQLRGSLKLKTFFAIGIQNISENFLRFVLRCSNLKTLFIQSDKSSIQDFNTEIIEMVSAMKKLKTIQVVVNSSHNKYFQSKREVMFTDHFVSHAT